MEARDAEAWSNEGENLALGLGTTDGQPEEAQTIKGTKLEILFPALLPLVGPGAMTPTKKVPGVVRSAAGIFACTCVELTTFETRFVLVLPELFQVTSDPATNPEPFMVMRISG